MIAPVLKREQRKVEQGEQEDVDRDDLKLGRLAMLRSLETLQHS